MIKRKKTDQLFTKMLGKELDHPAAILGHY